MQAQPTSHELFMAPAAHKAHPAFQSVYPKFIIFSRLSKKRRHQCIEACGLMKRLNLNFMDNRDFFKKKLDRNSGPDIVHSMNDLKATTPVEIPNFQLEQFQALITKLFHCCQERVQYQSERFKLPDAELRCLMLFGEDRYLTPKGITIKMNVVKSRVTKIINGLERKKLIRRIKDPEDSRVYLLSLTPNGQERLSAINDFLREIYSEVLLQMQPQQRKGTLSALEVLTASMNAVKEMMI